MIWATRTAVEWNPGRKRRARGLEPAARFACLWREDLGQVNLFIYLVSIFSTPFNLTSRLANAHACQ
jgi:hypothetical protein